MLSNIIGIVLSFFVAFAMGCEMGTHRKAQLDNTDGNVVEGYTPFDRNTVVQATIRSLPLGEGLKLQSISDPGIVTQKGDQICLHTWDDLVKPLCTGLIDHYSEGEKMLRFDTFDSSNEPLTWAILDRFDPPNWNVALIELWNKEKITATSEELIVRNLKQSQTKLIYVNANRLVVQDDQTTLNLKVDGDKITHSILKDPTLLSDFLYRSAGSFYTRPKENHLDLIEIKDNQVLKTGLNFESLDPKSVLKSMDERAIFIGDTISLAQGVKKGFLIEVEWQDESADLLSEIQSSYGILAGNNRLLSVSRSEPIVVFTVELGKMFKIDRMRHTREEIIE